MSMNDTRSQPRCWACLNFEEQNDADPCLSCTDESAYVDARAECRLLRAELAALRAQSKPVHMVATGETVDGSETYTRHDGSPPPMSDYETLYTAPVPATVPAGWKLVPVEPTEAMTEAARNVKRQRLLRAVEQAQSGKQHNTIGMALAVIEEWSAMLAAAPKLGGA